MGLGVGFVYVVGVKARDLRGCGVGPVRSGVRWHLLLCQRLDFDFVTK